MRKRILFASTIALVALTALPAAAIDDTTTLTVTLGAGQLTITAPELATGSATAGELSVVPVAVDPTTVSDRRGSILGFQVSLVSTDLTTGVGGPDRTLAAATMTWVPGAVAPLGGQLASAAVPAPALTLATPQTILVGASILSNGDWTYAGTVNVAVPTTNVAGAYSGILTHSVL